jgi:hypothetical protein
MITRTKSSCEKPHARAFRSSARDSLRVRYTIEGTDCSDGRVLVPVDTRSATIPNEYNSEMVSNERRDRPMSTHRPRIPLLLQVLTLDLSRKCWREKSWSRRLSAHAGTANRYPTGMHSLAHISGETACNA